MRAYQRIAASVEHFLSAKPNLSRKYIAQKAGVSNAYLSMVFQGKRALTEDLAIKLLRVLKEPSETIENYLKQLRLENNMPAVVKYYQERFAEENQIRMNRESSRILANDIDLLNCFEDILRLKKIHRGRLIDLYGRSVVEKLQILVRNETIRSEDDYFFLNDEVEFTLAPEDAVQLIKTSLDKELFEWQCGINVGVTNTVICELPDDAYKELVDLIEKQMKEAKQFIEEHKIKDKRSKGVKRMNLIHAITGLKHFSFLVLCFIFSVVIFLNHGKVAHASDDIVNAGDQQTAPSASIRATTGGTGPNGSDRTNSGIGILADQDGEQELDQIQDQGQTAEDNSKNKWYQDVDQIQDQFQE